MATTQCSSAAAADVEILVHVTAPSKVADDVAYRRLAQAYLSFAPGSRANVTIPSSPPEHQRPPPSRQGQQDDDHFTILQSFCSDSQDMSFRSALDNRSSPRVLSKKTRQPATPPPSQIRLPPGANVTTPTAAVRQLPSQIADSYPMPDADVFNVTPTRVLQRYMGSRLPVSTPAVQPTTASSPTLSSDVAEAHAVPDAADLKAPSAAAAAVNTPSSQPSSPFSQTEKHRVRREATIPATPIVPQANRKRKADEIEHVEDTSALDITHISSSITSTGSSTAAAAPLQRSESDPLPSKRLRQITTQDAAAGTIHLLRSVSDPNQRRLQQQPPPPPPSSSPLSYMALSQIPSTYPPSSFSSSLSIRPPSPPIGVANLALPNLISAKLAKLAQDLSSRYRPTLHRTLDPFERGYWLVDCTAWPAETRADAWAFLTSYVGSGLAGWGVWCKRSNGGGGGGGSSNGGGGGDGEKQHASIRLYGWAHVVKHTYLLLYLVSGRQIKTTGARWYDADGVVALEVVP